ncbi:hypothetical protein Pla110_35750 [Polystyrenella longa]|uniref:Tetratricopeptide repeat protein n=1 Tax=Polystyrenella longa TaxID=2528007 RepID=A0A518CRJ2_9PLAN|nr:hypothetical protein [Polystyrenella longa]QDU81824.1 hypothetical protein Pla110_35750 [Polystyrenella longa]
MHRQDISIILRLLVAVLLVSLLIVTPGLAQKGQAPLTDQIEIRKPNTGLTTQLNGEIVDFNGEELQFRTGPNQRVQYFSAEDILQTRYQQSPEHQRGVELYEQKKYTEAERSLETALKIEPRGWVRRELLALQIKLALASYDYEKAGNRFIALSASDEDTRYFHLIPLNWRIPEEGSESGPIAFTGEVPETTARRWLVDNAPVAQLLGASWLLFRDSEDLTVSRRLDQLSRNTNNRIQSSAQMQIWRQYVAEGRFSEIELQRWESRIESLQDLDRAGPYYLLATAYAKQLEFDHAAVRWLWPKANQAVDHLLSSDAQLLAAEALVRLGLSRQALIVYRELAEEYPESPAGKTARERIQID